MPASTAASAKPHDRLSLLRNQQAFGRAAHRRTVETRQFRVAPNLSPRQKWAESLWRQAFIAKLCAEIKIAKPDAMSMTLRYMRLDDVPHVHAIDKLCFQPPWSSDSYSFEITESHISHMVVLEQQTLPAPAPVEEGWLQRVSGWLGQEARADIAKGIVLGYGGLWKIDGEAHISTIATHPKQRGYGYGELLLAGMFRKALRLGAAYLVLEVRISNAIAQNLYQKYGFSRYGRKRNYYRSNNEDALDMRAQLDSGTRRNVERLYEELQGKFAIRDEYSEMRHPRTSRKRRMHM